MPSDVHTRCGGRLCASNGSIWLTRRSTTRPAYRYHSLTLWAVRPKERSAVNMGTGSTERTVRCLRSRVSLRRTMPRLVVACSLGLAAIAADGGAVGARDEPGLPLSVMTRTLYLGADVGQALQLLPDLPAAAQDMWNQVAATRLAAERLGIETPSTGRCFATDHLGVAVDLALSGTVPDDDTTETSAPSASDVSVPSTSAPTSSDAVDGVPPGPMEDAGGDDGGSAGVWVLFAGALALIVGVAAAFGRRRS